MHKQDYAVVALHSSKCSLCMSANRERHESDLLSGEDPDRIRRALNVEIATKTGKPGTVSRRAIIKHVQLLPDLRPRGGRTERAHIPELSEEILALPLSEFYERMQRLLWGVCWELISELQRRLTDDSEEMSLFELAECLRGFVDAYLVLRDNPPSGGSRRDQHINVLPLRDGRNDNGPR